MALPTYVGAGGGSETSCAWPAGHAAGDRALLPVEHGGGTVATPTGFSIVPGFPINQGGGSLLSMFTAVAASGAEGNAALAGGSNHMWGRIHVFRGVHATDPWSAIAAMKQSGATVNGTAPGVLTKHADCLVVNVIAYGQDNAGPMASAEVNASLAALTERSDDGTITGDGGGLVVYTGQKAVAGAVDPTTCTLVSTPFCAATIALRPADPSPSFTVAGTVTIDGAPAPDGMTVEIWDRTDGVLETTTTVAGGAGAFTASVKYNDHNYRAVADNGASYGASPLDQAV